MENFNSQPHEEADLYITGKLSGVTDFNSQPHEEADRRKEDINLPEGISTHSLTKRLTAISHKNF